MPDPTYQRTRRLLVLATWLIYALTSVGTLSVDPLTRFELAEAVARTGGVALPEEGIHTVEHDGRHYSVFFPGQSFVFLPPAALGVAASRLTGVDDETAMLGARFVASVFVMPIFGALGVLGHLAVVRRLGVGPRLAIVSGAVLAVGMPTWVWASSASEEPILGVLAIWAFRALLEARHAALGPAGDATRPARFATHLGVAGVLLAYGLVHRATFVTVAIGAAAYGLPLMVRHRHLLGAALPRFAGWAAATGAVLAVVPAYNWIRFGNPLDTGYATFYTDIGGVWGTPLLTGLRGHLISPGKSVFLYAPWLFLLPLALASPAVRRRLDGLAAPILLVIALHLVVYGKFTYWSGAFGWGVRFHVSLLPLLLVPIAVWLDGVRMTRLLRIELAVIAAASILVQVAGHTLNYGLEYRQHPEHYSGWGRLIPEDSAWTWRGAQLRLRFVNIARKARGEPLLDLDEDDERERIMTVWDIFPVRAQVGLSDRRIVGMLWAVWIGLLLLAIGAGAAAIVQWRRLPPGAGSIDNAEAREVV
jgi:hypothetical protein